MQPTVSDERPLSDHLVFFIHGIGQQYEEHGNLTYHVDTIQKNTEDMLATCYPDRRIRVTYIPIEWHTVVHKIVDDKMNKSTMATVPKVRLAANEWLMDCMYYFTKPHGQCIIDTICDQCNGAYQAHVEENPEFEGHVHMIGFSLGGVACYDILSMQWSLEEDGPPPWENVKPDPYVCAKPDVNIPKLEFKVQNLFTCGSPIAASLIFRGLDYMHFHPPPRTRVYNIFHPFDPLGYRLEPMVNSSYTSVQPVKLVRAQRKRILPVNIPKIPNLGIRSSIAGAAPLILKARRSFWQYMLTSSSEVTLSSGNDKDDEPEQQSGDQSRKHQQQQQQQQQQHPRQQQNTSKKQRPTHRKQKSSVIITQQLEAVTLPPSPVFERHSDSSSSYETNEAMEAAASVEQITDLMEQKLDDVDNASISSSSEASSNLGDDEQDDSDGTTPPSDNDDDEAEDQDSKTKRIIGHDGREYHRMDYTLQENVIDAYASEWIVAFKSHFRYWANRDLALHIAHCIAGKEPE